MSMKTVLVLLIATTAAVSSGRATAKPHIEHGRRTEYWEHSSVVFAEYLGAHAWNDPRKLPGDLLRPIGTLSGRFDASRYQEALSVFFSRDDFIGSFPPDARAKVKGQMVLVVLDDRVIGAGGVPFFGIPVTQTAFMKRSYEAMEVVDGFSDAQVAATLKAIQNARKDETPVIPARDGDAQGRATQGAADRYWSAHGVVFAEVNRLTALKTEEKLMTVVLRPRLTLAGTFDAGLSPEVGAERTSRNSGRRNRPPPGTR